MTYFFQKSVIPYRWSNNGQYLYLSPHCLSCWGDGPGLAFESVDGLFRLNLSTGIMDVWFEPEQVLGLSFSPDEATLIYVKPDYPNIIYLRDLGSGKEKHLEVKEKYRYIGNFVWTKSASELIVMAGSEEWWDKGDGISMFLYNLNSGRLQVLFENEKRNLFPAIGYEYETRIGSPWLSDDILILGDPVFGGEAWTINIRTGEIKPYITPTATP